MDCFFSRIFRTSYLRLLIPFFLFVSMSWYWFWTSSYYFCIPVRIDNSWNSPLIQMEIGGKKYEVKLDLGADFSTLYPHDINEMDKRPCGSHLAIGVRGNKYNRKMYEVSGVKFHEFYVPKMKILEDSYEFAVNSVITGNPEQITYSGRIGREIFKGKNFFLDFASSKIIVCSHFKDLARNGYDLKNFIEVPFETNNAGICIRAITDAGEQILNLDTGASCCFLRPPSEKIRLAFNSFTSPPNWRSQKFTLGSSEFGPVDFTLFEISPILDMIDGSLGGDFLNKHAVYIDAKKSVAYIEKKSIVVPAERRPK